MAFVNGYRVPELFSDIEPVDVVGDNCMIGPMFSVDGREDDYAHVWEWDSLSGSVWEDGEYDIVGLDEFEPCCVMLRHRGQACGFYMGGQSWIDPGHRGRGLGCALVVAAVAYSGELPDVRDIGFTEAGYRTHVSAAEMIRDLLCEEPKASNP